MSPYVCSNPSDEDFIKMVEFRTLQLERSYVHYFRLRVWLMRDETIVCKSDYSLDTGCSFDLIEPDVRNEPDLAIWLDPIYFDPQLGRYWNPPGRGKKSQFWDLIRILDLYPRSHSLAQHPDILWATVAAVADQNKITPSFKFRLWRKWTLFDPSEIIVGKRKFPSEFIISRWERKGKNTPTDLIRKSHRETYELKRWLHGLKSKHDDRITIVKRAARRRIIKCKVTAGDIQYFQLAFGASQVGRWMKEANTKNIRRHEYTNK